MSGVTKFGIKAGIIGSAAYGSSQIGIWGNSSQTEQLYKDIHQLAAPYIQEVPVQVPSVPQAGEISRAMVDGWNSGVLKTAQFIVDIPSYVSSLGETAYNKISDQIAAPEAQ